MTSNVVALNGMLLLFDNRSVTASTTDFPGVTRQIEIGSRERGDREREREGR